MISTTPRKSQLPLFFVKLQFTCKMVPDCPRWYRTITFTKQRNSISLNEHGHYGDLEAGLLPPECGHGVRSNH